MKKRFCSLILVFALTTYLECTDCLVCYRTFRGVITTLGRCQSCGIARNCCGSVHLCLEHFHEEGLKSVDGALYYVCNYDYCNYAIPLPTPPTKQILQHEITSSTGQADSF